MITKLTIRNFKRFENITFELGNPVVLIGPNNSGKTSILQALTLWDIGMRKWYEKRIVKKQNPKSKRTGVAINRKDLFSLPIPDAKLMWTRQHVREINREKLGQKTTHIKIEIEVEGINKGKNWKSGLELDYQNAEAFYCKPLNLGNISEDKEIIDDEAYSERIAYLQPMSGLASDEDKLTPGSIDVRVGMGKTADVLRNIIYQLINPERSTNEKFIVNSEEKWNKLRNLIKTKFLIDINKPDAHLEVIRQRDIYNLLVDVANEQNSQLIIASHSEVVLQQAGDADTVVAIFENKTQNLNTRQDISQLKKSLTEIGWDKYYYAKLKGYILYLEGPTDLLMLIEFAKLLNHPLHRILNEVNVHYISTNLPNLALEHFYGLKQIIKELKGIALFDRLDKEILENPSMEILSWKKREFENYFAFPDVIKSFIESIAIDLFNIHNPQLMDECIKDYIPPKALKDLNDRWWNDTKLSDDFLDLVFAEYFSKLNIRNTFTKGNYHELIKFLKPEEVDSEVKEKLDAIYNVLK